jgi:hypothetical protein
MKLQLLDIDLQALFCKLNEVPARDVDLEAVMSGKLDEVAATR